MKTYQKIALVIGILIIIWILLSVFNIGDYLTFENLHKNKVKLNSFVEQNYITAVLTYIGVYILVLVLALPGAAIMTLAGGVMFGVLPALVIVNIAATIGATLSFILSRYIMGDWVQKKYSERLKKFNHEMDNHGKNYLLTLRLIPIFPFFMINLAAGMTKIPLLTFIWTTSLGTIPGTFAYTLAGNNLSNIESPSEILSKEILIVFVVLGIISLVPTVIQKRMKTEDHSDGL